MNCTKVHKQTKRGFNMSNKEIKGKVTAEGLEEAIHDLLELRNKLVVATGMIKLRNKIYKEDDSTNPEFLLAQLVLGDINLIFQDLGLEVPAMDLDEMNKGMDKKLTSSRPGTNPIEDLRELRNLLYKEGQTLTGWIEEQSEEPN